MLIDLHCHTKNVKKGDGEKREPTIVLFKEKIELSQVKILAITNHNFLMLINIKILEKKSMSFVMYGQELNWM